MNPTRIDVTHLTKLCAEFEQQYGFAPTRFYETSVDDAGFAQTQRALEDDISVVIAAGGDGTVRLAAEVLAGTDVPLAIVPVGTGNLLARNLDLPVPSMFSMRADYRSSLRLAFAGEQRRIDLVRADVERPDGAHDSFVFAVIAGVGIDAGMISHTDTQLKKRIGWVAYGVGIAKWLRSSGSFKARYRIDGSRTIGTRASSIMVGNSGTLTGGLVLMHHAQIDDGRVDLAILRPRGPLGWPVVAAGIIARRWERLRGRRSRMLAFNQGEKVLLRLDSGPQEFQVDGDLVGPITAAKFTVLPLALRVKRPSQPLAD